MMNLKKENYNLKIIFFLNYKMVTVSVPQEIIQMIYTNKENKEVCKKLLRDYFEIYFHVDLNTINKHSLIDYDLTIEKILKQF
jgi:hypothetical protein